MKRVSCLANFGLGLDVNFFVISVRSLTFGWSRGMVTLAQQITL